MANSYHVGLCHHRTFPSSQKNLLESADQAPAEIFWNIVSPLLAMGKANGKQCIGKNQLSGGTKMAA